MAPKTIIIQGESLGRGDETLGKILTANFLRVLGDSKEKPEAIILWNAGVRLACEGSEMLEHLKHLEQQGVKVLACTTCLEYYDLREKLVVGEPTTMVKSIAAMMSTETITL